MKNFYKYLSYFCGALAILISCWIMLDFALSYTPSERVYTKWQASVVLLILILVLIGVFYSLYKKNFLGLLLLPLFLWQFFGDIETDSPDVDIILDQDICLMDNYCKAKYDPEINQESCLEESGAWNSDDEGCDYGIKLEECFLKEGNWLYPEFCNKSN